MMFCKYNDRDLAQRLDNSICRYKGEPRLVRYAGANTLELREMGSNKTLETILSNDTNLDISTVPLGYLQYTPDTVYYITRRPARMWKQGISNDSISFQPLSHDLGLMRPKVTVNSKEFKDMILNNYPDIYEILGKITTYKKKKEIAVSRDIALEWVPERGITYVYYKQEQVGFIPEGTKKIITKSSGMAWIITKKLSGFSWEIQ